MAIWNLSQWWKRPGMSAAEAAVVAESRESDRESVSRRDFLRAGGLGVVGLTLAENVLRAGLAGIKSRRCIFVLMSGGASQLDTFDPKPESGAGVRGPFRAIQTATPGVLFSEGLPQLARRSEQFSVVRTVHHDAAPIHETGLQLLQTGRLAGRGGLSPHFGAVVSAEFGPRSVPFANVIIPQPISATGVPGARGQQAGWLGDEWEPTIDAGAIRDDDSALRNYGSTEFGRRLLRARQLVEQGTRCVTVNLFDRLEGVPTWDCHGDPDCAPSTLADYRDWLCPQFDQALAALLDDLEERGLLEDTLVVATGELGRAPRINSQFGREHSTTAWSALFAGGGVRGGRVIGRTDELAMEPVDRPVAAAEITATILDRFGLTGATWTTDSLGTSSPLPICDQLPIAELF